MIEFVSTSIVDSGSAFGLRLLATLVMIESVGIFMRGSLVRLLETPVMFESGGIFMRGLWHRQ